MKRIYTNKILQFALTIFSLSLVAASCSDWVEIENKKIQDLEGTPKSAEYYANLRAYKESDHQVAFGWFGFWDGGVSTTARGSLRSAPDSMDIIAIWGAEFKYNLPEHKIADMRYVQEVYGTKVVFTTFAHDLPEGYERNDEGIKEYAQALCDSVYKYGYDGLDLDYEPGFGGRGFFASDYGYKDNMEVLLRELATRLGPASGADKLLIIDGVPFHLNEGLAELFDYGIVQAYNSSGDYDLQRRFNSAYEKGWKPEQYIFTENFESLWKTGGTTHFQTSEGDKMNSLSGMALFNPTQGKKAGCGAFHMEYEYAHNPEYKYMRKAIQLMNPAGTSVEEKVEDNPEGENSSK